MPKNNKYLIDLVERVLATAAQAALAVLLPILVAGELPDSTEGKAILIAGLAAGLAVLKGVLAKFTGSSNTAALLPYEDDTPKAA